MHWKRRHILAVSAIAILLTGLAVTIGLRLVVRSRADAAIHRAIDQMPAVQAVSYESIDVSLLGDRLRLDGVVLTLDALDSPLTADRVVIHAVGRRRPVPSQVHVAVSGLRWAADRSPSISPRRLPHRLGYVSVAGRLEGRFRYDGKRRRLTVERLDLAASDVGFLTASARLANLDMDDLTAHGRFDAGLVGRLGGVQIESVELAFTDDSLVQRLMADAARDRGMSEADLRRQLQRRFAPATGDPGAQRLQGLAAFLAHPERLIIRVAPPRPVSMLQLLWVKSLDELAERLNVTIASEPKQRAERFPHPFCGRIARSPV